MEIKIILFLPILQSLNILSAEGDSTISRSALFHILVNQRLDGHVVERFKSPRSLMTCSNSCLRKSWCTSRNVKDPSKVNSKGTCELNKHGAINENLKFHDKKGFTFSLRLEITYCLITTTQTLLERDTWLLL